MINTQSSLVIRGSKDIFYSTSGVSWDEVINIREFLEEHPDDPMNISIPGEHLLFSGTGLEALASERFYNTLSDFLNSQGKQANLGTNKNDILIPTNTSDILVGGDGNDKFNLGDGLSPGDDIIYAGKGVDTIEMTEEGLNSIANVERFDNGSLLASDGDGNSVLVVGVETLQVGDTFFNLMM